MSKAEQFIKDCTRSYSNVVYYHNRNFTHGTDYVEGSGIEVQYSPWLTPEQALRAVEIEREEMIDKACEWLEENLAKETSVIGNGNVTIKFRGAIKAFKRAMEE